MQPAAESFAPFFIDSGGVRLRAARFAVENARGVCVLLNGQTEFIEKYFEVIDELRRRGFAVTALDWRGQGGSERLLPDAPLKAHIHDFAEYDADLDALMDQMVLPALSGRRLIALAHSLGGHCLLRHLHRHRGRFAACVFSAPMVMYSTRGRPRWLVRALAGLMVRAGHATDFVWGIAGRDPLTMTFGEQIVTSDRVRFERTRDVLKQRPELRVTGPTWGWVAAADHAIARLEGPGFGEEIVTPVLICGAGHDRICVTAASTRFARRMPRARYLEIADAEHEILMERDVFRAQFWNAFDRFIAG